MFEEGAYVIYGSSGVCRIEKITKLDIPGIDNTKLHYVLVPLNNMGSRIYSPIDNTKVMMRGILTEGEVWQLINEIPNLDELEIENDRMREKTYKEAMQTCVPKEWVRLIKTIYQRAEERKASGKKITAVDERYLKTAKDTLYSEISLAIHKDKEDIEEIIASAYQ